MTLKLFSVKYSKAFSVPKSTRVHTSYKKSTPVHTSLRDSTQVLLCIPGYSEISESIDLFVIHSNIRVTQNYYQSFQIIKNYPIFSDPFESEKPFGHMNIHLFPLWKKHIERK